MVATKHFFWDSCVFTAFLKGEDTYDLNSIEQYLREAKSGDVMIHASTISSVEVLPSQIKNGGSFEDFLQDFQGAVHAIDPNPNIMKRAGLLRDINYCKGAGERRLGTPDAIILATALYVQEAEGIKLEALHTNDMGKKPGDDKKKSVPLIGFETWCDELTSQQKAVVAPVIALKRIPPIHPQPTLDF